MCQWWWLWSGRGLYEKGHNFKPLRRQQKNKKLPMSMKLLKILLKCVVFIYYKKERDSYTARDNGGVRTLALSDWIS